MAIFRFVVKPHATRNDEPMVEIWRGNDFVAGLFPGPDAKSLRVVSKHLEAATLDDSEYPPAVEILLRATEKQK